MVTRHELPVEINDFDSFDEVYKTHELTDFDKLLSMSITRTGE